MNLFYIWLILHIKLNLEPNLNCISSNKTNLVEKEYNYFNGYLVYYKYMCREEWRKGKREGGPGERETDRGREGKCI